MDKLAELKLRRKDRFESFKNDLNVTKLTKDICDLTDQELLLAWNENNLDASWY
jgi:hypothetical protein